MAQVDRKYIETALAKGVKTFSDMDLTGLDLSGLDFTGCNLHGSNMSGCDLTGCVFDKANLSWANIENAKIDSIKAADVVLYECKTTESLTAKKDITGDSKLADMQVKYVRVTK